MFSSSELYNKRVFVTNKKGARKSYGKIRSVVFHPSKAQAVGLIVKRPDLALMVKRKDSFVAMDRIEIREDGPLIIDQPDTWDTAACRRLGIEYDQCILWDYMPVKTTSGRELGAVSSVFFDEGTFKVDHIDISTGSASRKILGASNIVRQNILGYKDGAIIVDDSIGEVREAGGVAAQAGEAWATAKHKGSQVVQDASAKAQEAGKRAGEAVDKGAYGLGKAIGSLKTAAGETAEAAKAEASAHGGQGAQAAPAQTKSGKAAQKVGRQLGRASHMFKDFKDEFDKASK